MKLNRLTIALIVLLTGCTPNHSDDNSQSSGPIATYRDYLLAIKSDNEAAAKACWWISDDNRSGALDVLIGVPAVHHRCATLLTNRFGDAAKPYLEEIKQFTDASLDPQLAQLSQAKVKVEGDTAVMTFQGSMDVQDFRRVNGQWKLDANAHAGLKDPADFFKPGSWGPMFAGVVKFMREINAELERGDFKTIEEFNAAVKKKGEGLKKLLESPAPGK